MINDIVSSWILRISKSEPYELEIEFEGDPDKISLDEKRLIAKTAMRFFKYHQINVEQNLSTLNKINKFNIVSYDNHAAGRIITLKTQEGYYYLKTSFNHTVEEAFIKKCRKKIFSFCNIFDIPRKYFA